MLILNVRHAITKNSALENFGATLEVGRLNVLDQNKWYRFLRVHFFLFFWISPYCSGALANNVYKKLRSPKVTLVSS